MIWQIRSFLSPLGPDELRMLLRALADEHASGGERGAPWAPARRLAAVPALWEPAGCTRVCQGRTSLLSAGRYKTGAGAQAPACNVKARVIQGVAMTEHKQRTIPAGSGFHVALNGELSGKL